MNLGCRSVGKVWRMGVCAGVIACAVGRAGAVGCADFEVEQPRPHGGVVLNAADFGMSVTNENNAAALNRALAEAKRVRADRLEVPKGTYRCHGPVGIVMDGLEDFVLDGHDSLFVFDGKQPYRLQSDAGGTRYDAATRIVEFGNVTTGR